MNEVMMLRGAEPRKILETAQKEGIDAIMSYISKGKWHVAKVSIKDLEGDFFCIQLCPQKKRHPVNVSPDQQIGLSIKHDYGKFVFESRIESLLPSENGHSGGKMKLRIPLEMDLVQRRCYYRVQVPSSIDVKAEMQQRHSDDKNVQASDEGVCSGELVDISAGGLQLAAPGEKDKNFREGSFVLVKFIPLPFETPMTLSCQVRSILPTVDGNSTCYGLQIVGLEASAEGRMTLSRLANVVEQYYQMNNSEMKGSKFANMNFRPVMLKSSRA
jgi:c-di-GMP-binding flagellar brake protein YcgR